MNSESPKKLKLATLFWTILLLVALYVIAIGFIIYFIPSKGKLSENRLIKKTTAFLPYPAALVGKNIITTGKLSSNFDAMKKFYESQDFSTLGMRIDFSTEDGKKRLQIKEKEILNKLIENSVIKAEANKRNIILTPNVIDQEVDRKLKEYGTENQLKENLQKLYGWELRDFKENIVAPDLYKEKLFLDIRKENTSFTEAKNKISEAQKELAGGIEFSDVVKKYSEGQSAQNSGSLGWFNYNQMLPEVAEAIFNLEKEKTSEIIESSIGYHIVRVDDKKDEAGQKMVKVSQIFVRTESFSEWLIKQEKKYHILIPSNIFKWNSENGEVEFEKEEMKNFEKRLFENNTNDPSLIF